MPQIVRTGPLLGLMVRGLKLPFPRQAGGKGPWMPNQGDKQAGLLRSRNYIFIVRQGGKGP